MRVQDSVPAAPAADRTTDRDAHFASEALPWLDHVYRFAQSLAGNPAEAEDLTQETFLRAYASWRTYRPGSECKRWLFKICHNVFLRTRARERRYVTLYDATGALTTILRGAGAPHDPSDGILARIDLVPAIRRALARLPAPFRAVVVLVDVEGQAYEAAAEILGIPIGTVRSRLSRARRLLRAMLLAHRDGPEHADRMPAAS